MALDAATLSALSEAVSAELQRLKSAATDRANEDFTKAFNGVSSDKSPLSEAYCIQQHLKRIQELPTRFLARDVFDQLLNHLGQHPDPNLRKTDPNKFAVAVALACASSRNLWQPPHLRDLIARIAEIHHLMVDFSAPPSRAMDFTIAYLHGWRREPALVWTWKSTMDLQGNMKDGWVTAPGWQGVPDEAQVILAAEIHFSVFSLLAWMAADRRAPAERPHNNEQAEPEERVDGAGHVLHLGHEFCNTVTDRFLEKGGCGCKCWKELAQGENENQDRRMGTCLRYHRLRSWNPSDQSFGLLTAFIQKAIKGFAGSPDTGSEDADGSV